MQGDGIGNCAFHRSNIDKSATARGVAATGMPTYPNFVPGAENFDMVSQGYDLSHDQSRSLIVGSGRTPQFLTVTDPALAL